MFRYQILRLLAWMRTFLNRAKLVLVDYDSHNGRLTYRVKGPVYVTVYSKRHNYRTRTWTKETRDGKRCVIPSSAAMWCGVPDGGRMVIRVQQLEGRKPGLMGQTLMQADGDIQKLDK